MAEKIIAAKLTLDGAEANSTVKSFKSQLKEANYEVVAMSEKFGETSEQAVAAARKVASLKDAIGDAKALSDAFSPDAKFAAFGQAVQGVTGGFAALQGAMSLFGSESKEVEQALLKVQSAMAIQQGLDSVMGSIDGFKNLATVIKQTTLFRKADAAATAIATQAQRLFGIEVVATSTSFKVLKGAIASTGIGLLAVAIGILAEKLMTMGDETDKAADSQEAMKKATDALTESVNKQNVAIDRAAALATAQAKATGESEEAIIAIQRKALEEKRIAAFTAVRIARETSADELKAKEDLQKAEDALRIFDLNQVAKSLDDKKALQKKAAEDEKREVDERKKKSEEDRKEQNALELQQAKEQAEAKIKAEALAAGQHADASGLDINKIQIDKNAEMHQIIADQNAAAAEAMINQRNELAAQLESDQMTELEKLNAWYTEKVRIVGDNEALQLALKEDYEDKKTKLEASAQKQRLDIAQNLLGQAAGLFARHTAAYKIIAVAQATIQTFQSAQAAFTGMVTTFPGPWGIAAGVAAAAVAVAAGLKNIQGIMKTKVPGGSEGGASTPSISTESVTAPLTPQRTTTTLDQDSINGVGNAAAGSARAYVVESDMTDSQERITRLNRAARLGG